MVSSISNTSGRVAMPPPPSPEDAFKKIDSTNKGYITESDLASAIVQFSHEAVSLSHADSLAKDAFKKMDASGDGKVTRSEFVAAAPKNAANAGPPAGRPSGPPPGAPAGPPSGTPPGGGPGGPAEAKDASTSGPSQTYDPADTNKDGTVIELERLTYASKHETSNTVSGITASTK